MKIYYLSIVTMLFLVSCKNDKSTVQEIENQTEQSNVVELAKQPSVVQNIAEAYGISNWKNVNQVDFTFVVNPGEKEFARIWSWQPKSKTVSLISATDTITYNRAKVTEEFVSTDKAFVNDSFWFSFPFHLVWDEITVEELGQTTSPILQKEAFKIKINYPQEGGYTPGDSYEIYIDDNHNILEWTYHPKGQEEPALGNTFENQKTFNGIKIDTEHSNPEKGFQLNFRDVVIK